MIVHGSKRLLKLDTTMSKLIAKESNEPKDVTKTLHQTLSLSVYIGDLETVGPFFMNTGTDRSITVNLQFCT
jgi:arginyl-tRNA synthetase